VVAVLGIAAAIGPVLMIIGPLATGFGIIAPIVAGIGATLMTVVLPAIAAILIPLLPIIIAVAAIGIGLYLLYTYFKPFHDAVNQVLGWIKTLVGDLMSGNFGKLGADFKAGIMAGIDALKKINWGSLATQFLTALLGIPPQLFKALQSLDWGGLASSIITFLTTDVPKFLDALKNLDWGGFAMTVLEALCNLDIMFWSSLINLDWGGFATTVYNALIGALGAIIGWFQGLDWGSVGTTILNAFESALNGFGGWLAGSIGNALHGISFDTHIPGIGVVTLGTGGLVTKPTLAMIGETGPELVVPTSDISSFGMTSAQPIAQEQGAGGFSFNVTINNPVLTSDQAIDKVSLQLGYKTQEVLRRSGHLKG